MSTFYLLLKILLVPLHSWLDRQRGSSDDTELIPKALALSAMCIVQLILLGVHDWSAIAVCVVVWVSYVIGWGQPLGAIVDAKNSNREFEWWQFGPLKERPFLAMFTRGLLILPIAVATNVSLLLGALLVGLFDNSIQASIGLFVISPAVIAKLTIAYAIAFPLAPWLVLKYRKARGDQAWAEQDYVRGFILVAILLAVSPL